MLHEGSPDCEQGDTYRSVIISAIPDRVARDREANTVVVGVPAEEHVLVAYLWIGAWYFRNHVHRRIHEAIGVQIERETLGARNSRLQRCRHPENGDAYRHLLSTSRINVIAAATHRY